MTSTELPDEDSELILFEFVKNFQVHRHYKACQNYRNKKSLDLILVDFSQKEL